MSELNTVKIECGAIKQKGETVFEGFQISLELTDKSYETEVTGLLKALPMFLDLASSKIAACMESDQKRYADRKVAVDQENKAILEAWEKECAEWEKAKAAFDKKYAEWEKRQQNRKKDDCSFDPEPTFYERKPSRPHLHVW